MQEELETSNGFHVSGKTCEKGISEALQTGAGVFLSDFDTTGKVCRKKGERVYRVLESWRCGGIFGGADEIRVVQIPFRCDMILKVTEWRDRHEKIREKRHLLVWQREKI